MRIRSKLLTTAAAAILIPVMGMGVSAQVPESTDVQAQAAAIPLTTSDLPTGFNLIGETFLPLPDGVAGATSHYVSVYTNIGSGQQIRSYVYTFGSADQAAAGFDALEGTEAETLSDQELQLGSGKAEISTGTYQDADGKVIGTADATFVRGAAVIGVAVDNPDGTVPDAQLAQDLAGIADARAEAVEGGSASVDLTLPARLVPFAQSGVVTQAGYLSPAESEVIYGTQGSGLSGATNIYVQTVAFSEGGSAPRVTIGVSTYANANDAKAIVEGADQIFLPLSDQQKVEDAALDGADAVVAYQYTSRDGSIAERESYRIIFAQGETVTVVDVQGAENSDVARSAAESIVGAQQTCQSGGGCEAPAAAGVIPN